MSKIGWILRREGLPSSRIGGMNIINFLNQNTSLESEVIGYSPDNFDNYDFSKFDLIMFQKLFDKPFQKYVVEAKKQGVKTAFSVCDYEHGRRGAEDDIHAMVGLVEAPITPVERIADVVKERTGNSMYWIRDAIETPNDVATMYNNNTDHVSLVGITSHNLHIFESILGLNRENYSISHIGKLESKLVLTGKHGTSEEELAYQNTWRYDDLYLMDDSEYGVNKIIWSLDTVFDNLRHHDIGIIPIHSEIKPSEYKGCNRATLMMSLGMPVIASPLQGYDGVIEHGKTGFFAESEKEWVESLELLRLNPDLRKSVGMNARDHVYAIASIEQVGNQYAKVFERVINS